MPVLVCKAIARVPLDRARAVPAGVTFAKGTCRCRGPATRFADSELLSGTVYDYAGMDPSHARLHRPASARLEIKLESTPRNVDKDTPPQAKVQALEQFVMFGRKGKPKKDHKENHKTTEFPPASWFDSTTTFPAPPPVGSGSGISAAAARSIPSQHALPRNSMQLPTRANSASPRPSPGISRRRATETSVDFSNAVGTTAALSPPGTNQAPTLKRRGASFPGPAMLDTQPEAEIAPEPLTLARRIQAMLGARTIPPTPSATDATTSSGAVRSEAAGPATPGGSVPPAPAPIADSSFLTLLGNANIMSGSLDKGRQSVFAILDRLRRPSARAMEAHADSAPSFASEEEPEDSEEHGDDISIMLYSPLVPNEDSEVELAASDIMSVFDDGETLEFEQPARPLSFIATAEQLTPRSSYATLPPDIPVDPASQEGADESSLHGTQKEQGASGWFDALKGKVIEGGKLVSDKVGESTKLLKDKKAEGRKVVKTTTRWVPSPDKISFQATWWGYRLCVYVLH